ncbi:hypothetical protein TNCV_1350851 [Trichonephila clavipes]|nr:hypothetical protein TNCV_1350851 [Trichonephila clavipes]
MRDLKNVLARVTAKRSPRQSRSGYNGQRIWSYIIFLKDYVSKTSKFRPGKYNAGRPGNSRREQVCSYRVPNVYSYRRTRFRARMKMSMANSAISAVHLDTNMSIMILHAELRLI